MRFSIFFTPDENLSEFHKCFTVKYALTLFQMERKKHKRLTTDTILKPEDLKKARVCLLPRDSALKFVQIQKTAGSASASSSSSSSGVFKAKLDFRSAAPPAPKPNQHINSTGDRYTVL